MAMKRRGTSWAPTGSSARGWEDQTLWKHPGHDMTQQELDKGVEQILAALKKN